jgi:hypothetical protein
MAIRLRAGRPQSYFLLAVRRVYAALAGNLAGRRPGAAIDDLPAEEKTMASTPPPIRRIDGKFRAVGAVVTATGLVAALAGTWWGPAMLFPGAALLLMGHWSDD